MRRIGERIIALKKSRLAIELRGGHAPLTEGSYPRLLPPMQRILPLLEMSVDPTLRSTAVTHVEASSAHASRTISVPARSSNGTNSF
jgi:hypothetical protein